MRDGAPAPGQSEEVDPDLDQLLKAADAGAPGLVAVPRPGPCRVWRVGGAPVRWLKRFGSHRAWRQERDALETWGPFAARVPRVLAASESAQALLLSHVDGAPGDGVEVWRAAGIFSRQLQAGGAEDLDPMPLPEAMDRRFAAWGRQAAEHLSPGQWSAAQAAWQPQVFDGAVRRRCHRDFQPRNWLWDGRSLGVIDFEHARWDHPWVDAVRLRDCVGEDDPRWRAFFEGADAPTGPAFDGLRLLHALGSIAWGVREGDAGFEAQGRALLAERVGAL